jgi:signal peptidase I
MHAPRIRKLLSGGLALAALACLWLYLAPTGLGGSTTYVVTDGISMEPHFHAGDLALVRSQSSYHVGEIVAYHSKAFHTIVLHRIVRIDGARYVFKGDNNNFVDFEHPARSQLIGALWLHIAGAGSRLESLRSPQLVGILIGIATLLFCGAAFTSQRRRRRNRRSGGTDQPPSRLPQARPAEPAVGILAVGLIALLPFVALTLIAFTRPSTSLLPYEVPYKQSGTLSYTANTAPGPIYAGDRAVTGEPLFTHVVNSVQLHFGYHFRAAAAHSLSGSAALYAKLASTSGWQTTFRLGRTISFRGDHASLDANLDLSSLLGLLRRVQATTAVSGSYTLTLTPHVEVNGSLGALPLDAAFFPQMNFAVNQLEVQPAIAPGGTAAGQSSASQLSPSLAGSATGWRYQPLFISLKLMSLSVLTARRIALGGIVTVLLAMVAALIYARPRRRDEAATIRARYGRLIVPVERVWQLPGAPVIDVEDIDALVRIAEHYDRAILQETAAEGTAFWVIDESGQFRYALETAEWALHAAEWNVGEPEWDVGCEPAQQGPVEILVDDVYVDELPPGLTPSFGETQPAVEGANADYRTGERNYTTAEHFAAGYHYAAEGGGSAAYDQSDRPSSTPTNASGRPA